MTTKTLIKTGAEFGRLIVVGGVDNEKVLCRCVCGQVKLILRYSLFNGHTRSCGCFQKEAASKTRMVHGHTSSYKHSPEYGSWDAMIQRCYNRKTKFYFNYGGRGISVCERWRHSFEHFLTDNGFKPSSKHTLDRINNDGNYEPGNCRWATRKEQQRNRRGALNVGGVLLTELAEKNGLSYDTVWFRYRHGDRGENLIRLSRRNREIVCG